MILVGQVGIEPTANRLKAYCSTTELLTQRTAHITYYTIFLGT